MTNYFIDEVRLQCRAGNGGDGIVCFRREKYIPRGGPDGGNGGAGGSIYLYGSNSINTLCTLQNNAVIQAEHGHKGGSSNKTGADGQDIHLSVPFGTGIFNDNNICIAEINTNHQEVLIAQGGYGGLGNRSFKSSTNRAPYTATAGQPGMHIQLILKLRLLAYAGFLGLPNVGKSSLMRCMTASETKVANYAFTTLRPYLGILHDENIEENKILIADFPGIISGASIGRGLGTRFLAHLQKTKILLEVLAIDPKDSNSLQKQHEILIQETTQADATLSHKSRWIIINKIDLVTNAQSFIQNFLDATSIPAHTVFAVSAKTQSGIQALKTKLLRKQYDE